MYVFPDELEQCTQLRMIWACATTSLVFACPWMARHRVMFNRRHKGFSSWEQNEIERSGVQAICSTVNSTTAVASPWIKRCFSQQRQSGLMVSLMMVIIMSYSSKLMGLHVEDGVVDLERVAVVLAKLEHHKPSNVQSTLQKSHIG